MKYEETWSSLKRHRDPEWLDDAKLGIYFHWGIWSVPAFGNEWYSYHMYRKTSKEYRFHQKTYGDPSKFGYKDLIPKFTAEKWDPNEWAALFKKAGAKFAGPVAEHCDGFSMWDSKVNRWNAKNMGPCRDVVGELAKAIRSHGLKFYCSFHHQWHWNWYYHSKDFDTGNPEYADLYGPIHELDSPKALLGKKTEPPTKEFCDRWLTKVIEVIDGYQPDMLYFDSFLTWMPDAYVRKMIAYYYNQAESMGKEVNLTYKMHDIPPGVAMVDYERGALHDLTYYRWITDTSLGQRSWGYLTDEVYKSDVAVIQSLVNNISHNGYLLINFGPMPTGEIPPIVRERFEHLGKWLETNREGIYGSVPWTMPEEGPTKPKEKGGGFNENKEPIYTAKDIRITSNGTALYAFCLGLPHKEVIIHNLSSIEHYIERDQIQSVSILGVPGELDFKFTDIDLRIQVPTAVSTLPDPCKIAVCFKIQLKK